MKIVKDTPDIETRRLLLKQVCIEDAADIYAYTLNPNVLRYTTGTPPKAFSEAESFVRGLVGKPAGDFAWAIRPKTGSVVIGVIELDIRERRSASIDYALAERYWNQGIMTESARALLDWAFRTYPTLESLHSSALTANPASTRVQQKCGMQFQRTETQTWSKFDEPVELAFYSISRAEWAASSHS